MRFTDGLPTVPPKSFQRSRAGHKLLQAGRWSTGIHLRRMKKALCLAMHNQTSLTRLSTTWPYSRGARNNGRMVLVTSLSQSLSHALAPQRLSTIPPNHIAQFGQTAPHPAHTKHSITVKNHALGEEFCNLIFNRERLSMIMGSE